MNAGLKVKGLSIARGSDNLFQFGARLEFNGFAFRDFDLLHGLGVDAFASRAFCNRKCPEADQLDSLITALFLGKSFRNALKDRLERLLSKAFGGFYAGFLKICLNGYNEFGFVHEYLSINLWI